MWHYCLETIFAGWLVLTILIQFPNTIGRWCSKLDGPLILPTWAFFAPNPGVTDYHLFYRSLAHDGYSSDWAEISAFEQTKPASISVWNPKRRLLKAKYGLLADLVEASARPHPDGIACSVCYVVVAKHVLSRIPSELDAVQFAIKSSSGYVGDDTLRSVFISEVVNRS